MRVTWPRGKQIGKYFVVTTACREGTPGTTVEPAALPEVYPPGEGDGRAVPAPPGDALGVMGRAVHPTEANWCGGLSVSIY